MAEHVTATLQIPPDSRYGGAQKHMREGWTTGHMLVAGVAVAAVIAFIAFLAISAAQQGNKKR